MLKPSLLLSFALLALPSVASARPYDPATYVEPEQQCHDAGEAAYRLAEARGDGSPDVPADRAQAMCLWTAYRNHLIASRHATLDQLIALDQDGESFFVEAGWN